MLRIFDVASGEELSRGTLHPSGLWAAKGNSSKGFSFLSLPDPEMVLREEVTPSFDVAAQRGSAQYVEHLGASPLFQAATANLNPWTEAQVDTENPQRGPLLIISGEKDNTVPWAIANASFKRQQRNDGVTEIVEMPNRGDALTIDGGWREVADKALAFVERFV